jgi:hypothetical protein
MAATPTEYPDFITEESPGGGGQSFDAENKSGGIMPAGSPAAIHQSGVGVISAGAADNSRPGVGLVLAAAGDGEAATVVTEGPMSLDDWIEVTGTEFLAARATYYLGLDPGTLTTVPPEASSQIAQVIGWAISPTTLLIQIDSPLEL